MCALCAAATKVVSLASAACLHLGCAKPHNPADRVHVMMTHAMTDASAGRVGAEQHMRAFVQGCRHAVAAEERLAHNLKQWCAVTSRSTQQHGNTACSELGPQ